MTHPTDTAKSDELKACKNPHLDADPRDEAVRTIFAETAIMMTHPDDERRALAKERVYSLLFAHPVSSPPQNDAGVEDDAEEAYQIGKREGYEEALADVDRRTGGDGEYFASTIPGRGCPDGHAMMAKIVDRFEAGAEALAYYANDEHYDGGDVPGHIYVLDDHGRTARAALGRTPMSELQALGQEFEAGWRPIETAPKDGTEILLGAPAQTFRGQPTEPRSTIGHWMTEEECREQIGDCGGECRCPEYKFHDPYWLSWDGGFTEENPPTHWMPLPSAPSGEG